MSLANGESTRDKTPIVTESDVARCPTAVDQEGGRTQSSRPLFTDDPTSISIDAKDSRAVTYQEVAYRR